MSILDDLQEDTDITGEETDSLGGGYLLESDIYNMTVQMAYLDVSKNGAKCVKLEFKDKDGNTLRDTIYFTNRKGEHFYVKDGNKHFNPGYNKVNSMANVMLGKSFRQLKSEPKTVMIYDWNSKSEVPTEKDVLMELINQPVKVGVMQVVEDKNIQNSEKVYVPSGETRAFNQADKFFGAKDSLTSTEKAANLTAPDFINKWKEKFAGGIQDKSTGVRHASLGESSGSATASSPTPDDLFE
ncbi:MAG: hypothetical protein DRI65_17890 [Chloroflexota bacterium]|nr:MAG: hypothetical protein DRI65_17890 [Chloroflexota bacterium]